MVDAGGDMVEWDNSDKSSLVRIIETDERAIANPGSDLLEEE